jgi:hypothetical protein
MNHPLPSRGGSYEFIDGELVEREAPTAPDPGKSARAAPKAHKPSRRHEPSQTTTKE